jgi:hypothetical protein
MKTSSDDKFDRFCAIANRVVIRSLRIACGMVVAFFAWVFLGSPALEILSEPFAKQSPVSLVNGLALGAGAAFIYWIAWYAAFGEGESEEMRNARLEGERRIKAGNAED